MLRIGSFAACVVVSLSLFACASAPKQAPMTAEEAALAAPIPASTASRADDPAFNPSGDMEFSFKEREATPSGAPHENLPGTSMRADDSVKKNKQRVKPASP